MRAVLPRQCCDCRFQGPERRQVASMGHTILKKQVGRHVLRRLSTGSSLRRYLLDNYCGPATAGSNSGMQLHWNCPVAFNPKPNRACENEVWLVNRFQVFAEEPADYVPKSPSNCFLHSPPCSFFLVNLFVSLHEMHVFFAI